MLRHLIFSMSNASFDIKCKLMSNGKHDNKNKAQVDLANLGVFIKRMLQAVLLFVNISRDIQITLISLVHMCTACNVILVLLLSFTSCVFIALSFIHPNWVTPSEYALEKADNIEHKYSLKFIYFFHAMNS